MSAERFPTTARVLHPGRWGITPRLLALVLVPLLGLLVLAVSTTAANVGLSDRASDERATVERASLLVTARAALFAERVPSEAITGARSIGLDPANVLAVLDEDVWVRLGSRRAATDAAIAALGADGPVTAADVADLRAQVDADGDNRTAARFRPLEKRLDDAVVTALMAHHTGDNRHLGGSDATAVLTLTRAVIEAVEATLDQLSSAQRMALGTPDEWALSRDVAAAQAREDTELARLNAALLPEVAGIWAPVRDHPVTARWLATMAHVAHGDPIHLGDPDGVGRLVEMVRDGLTHVDHLLGIVPALTEVSRGVAGAQVEAAREAAHFGMLLPAAVALISVAVSLVCARSIARPCRRLAARAAAIGAGELRAEPRPASMPAEITVAYDAFDDLVANLELIEAKGQALADLDLDAPVLAEPLPGRLGAALQRSARALSGSVGERDDLRRRLLQQATQDSLTGLPNRTAATDALEGALGRSRRSGAGVAVLHVDLDDFKRANDTHGNAAGDAVLVEMATRLTAAAGDHAFVARLAADEYLVLVEGVTDPGTIDELARRLRTALARPVRVGGAQVTTGASIGVAFSWTGEDPADQVLAWAHLAMGRAKERAAGSIEIYDRGLQEQLRELADVEDALRRALREDELFLQYQPVVDLGTGRMSSVEALVRWDRPGVGLRPPDTFIPVAERSDLIIELDSWVLARAARQLEEWDAAGELPDVPVAVNVSGRHLTSQTLYEHVAALLDATGVDPRRLVIEITETVLVNDLVMAAAQLEAVRRLGVRVALDDFGTGYTSLAHLRHLPIDIIKIDRSLVQRLGSEKERRLLAMITELGHHLGMTITAEGVETAEQYETLRQLGCDRVQGYLMSRPLPAGDLPVWVRDQEPAPTAETA